MKVGIGWNLNILGVDHIQQILNESENYDNPEEQNSLGILRL